MDTTQQQSALKVSVQPLDLAGTSRRAMWIRWSNGESGGPQDLAAYDVNLLLENGRVFQLAHGLPANAHELISTMEVPGRAKIQVVGVRAGEQGLEQGITSWMERGAPPEEQVVSDKALLVAAGAPAISTVYPKTLKAGTTRVTIEGKLLPQGFGYAVTHPSGQPVIGTGTGFPVGTPSKVTLDIYVSASVQPGSYQLRASNPCGSDDKELSIETQARPPVISSLTPGLISSSEVRSSRERGL